MKKLIAICFILAMISTMVVLEAKADEIDGGPTGWGWCSTCKADKPSSHDFTHGN